MEMVRYATKLKLVNQASSLDSATFNAMVEDRVKDILNIMNLNSCKHRKIPEYPPYRGPLGSDLRRLSIAIDICALPPLIVIEEPSLNLEASLALDIVRCLRLQIEIFFTFCLLLKNKLFALFTTNI